MTHFVSFTLALVGLTDPFAQAIPAYVLGADQIFLAEVLPATQHRDCRIEFKPVRALKGEPPPTVVGIRDCGGKSLESRRIPWEPPPPYQAGEMEVVFGKQGQYWTARRQYWDAKVGLDVDSQIRHVTALLRYWSPSVSRKNRTAHLAAMFRSGELAMVAVAAGVLSFENSKELIDADAMASVLAEQLPMAPSRELEHVERIIRWRLARYAEGADGVSATTAQQSRRVLEKYPKDSQASPRQP